MLWIENNCPEQNLPLDRFEAALEAVRLGEGIPFPVSVDLTLVAPEEIRSINRDSRAKDQVTDVLSFPALAYEPGLVFSQSYDPEDFGDEAFVAGALYLGDVLLCPDRARNQAKEYNHSLERELVFLFVHSLLHLCGYDHMTEADRARMRQKEEHYMNLLGVSR